MAALNVLRVAAGLDPSPEDDRGEAAGSPATMEWGHQWAPNEAGLSDRGPWLGGTSRSTLGGARAHSVPAMGVGANRSAADVAVGAAHLVRPFDF